MLYIVTYKERYQSSSRDWWDKKRYAVGDTAEEAVKFAKDKAYNESYVQKNFVAELVTEYDQCGDFKLYNVFFEKWNCTFSGTLSHTVQSIGRCPAEAIAYAKAYYSKNSWVRA